MNTAPKLPSGTDGPAIASYIVSVASMLFGVLAEVHIGLPSNAPSLVSELALPVGTVVAAVVQLVNIITHRGAHKAAVRSQGTPPTAPYKT